MKQKTKRILKYLFGFGAGCILAGAVVGGIVSCSNGSQTQQTQPTTSTKKTDTTKPTSSTSDKTSKPKAAPTKSEAKDTTPTIPAYQLQTEANTSAIAYKSNDPNSPTMFTTNVLTYNKLISKPNNVVISVLGTPEAVINVKNDTNSKTAPDITLDLNQNSSLYQECLAHTNNATDLNSLSNLITFSTTKTSTDTFNVNNTSQKSSKNDYKSS